MTHPPVAARLLEEVDGELGEELVAVRARVAVVAAEEERLWVTFAALVAIEPQPPHLGFHALPVRAPARIITFYTSICAARCLFDNWTQRIHTQCS